MRVSTALLHQRGIDNLQQQQQALLRTQTQLATQQKMLSAQDDPSSWAAAMGQDQFQAQTARFMSNAQHVQFRLGLQENAIADAGDVMARVRELVIQGNTASQAPETRAIIAEELRGLRDALTGIANRDDGQGRYLFGGTQDAAPPFSWNGSATAYHGDGQVRELAIGTARVLAEGDSGDTVFMRLATGDGRVAIQADAGNQGSAALRTQVSTSTLGDAPWSLQFNGGQYEVRDASSNLIADGVYQPGATIQAGPLRLQFDGQPVDGDQFALGNSASQDAVALIDRLSQLMDAPQAGPADRARVQTAIQQGLMEVQATEDHFLQRRTSTGLRLQAAEDAKWSLGAQALASETRVSELRDVDFADAAARLQRELTAIQAAQLAYSRVQSLSLFDYLR